MTCRPLALALLLLALLPASAARASATQESTVQDDEHLVYAPPAEVRATLDELAALGADRLRITVVWAGVAPEPTSRRRPDFDAEDPAAYPPGVWDKFDLVAREAAERGMGVNFNVSAPAPLWATEETDDPDIQDTFRPSPEEFGRFVTAVGRRYSGEAGLPRVDYWSIWNEPNQSGWLTPQWVDARKGRFVEASPRIYRALADAAYAALVATGHERDTILVGDTAPKGDPDRGITRRMKARTFVRRLYCLDDRDRPLRGARAQELGCEPRREFAARHPVLFRATGYAHHPYELLLSPAAKPPDRDYITLSTLGRLTRALDRAFAAYGAPGRLPLYLTEHGYQTDPPDPFAGVPYAAQARYLNQSEFLAFGNPRVRTLAQFLLYDDGAPYGRTFQSGLRREDGTAKPALAAYKLPIWVPRTTVRRGRRLTVWAMLRTALTGSRSTAQVEFRPRGGARWRRLKTVRTENPRGYLVVRVRGIRRAGTVRVRFGELRSRAVRVRVRVSSPRARR